MVLSRMNESDMYPLVVYFGLKVDANLSRVPSEGHAAVHARLA